MSEEQRNEETEVEAHGGLDTHKFDANSEPEDEVEAHGGTIGKVDYPKPS